MASYNPGFAISHLHAASPFPDRCMLPFLSRIVVSSSVSLRMVFGSTLYQCSQYSERVEAGFVDHHTGTLSLETGVVNKEGQTDYLWAPPFIVVRIPIKEMPPQSLETASVGWFLFCMAGRIDTILIKCVL